MSSGVINKYLEIAQDIVAIKPAPELSKRKEVIATLNNNYFIETGATLPPHILNILTDWFLLENLTNKDTYKVQKEEYPILSKHQERRRTRKATIVKADTLDHLSAQSVHTMRKTTVTNGGKKVYKGEAPFGA